MPYLRICGLEFEKTIVVFGINTLKFVYLQNFTKKQKCLNLGIFGLEFENNLVIFKISTLGFV